MCNLLFLSNRSFADWNVLELEGELVLVSIARTHTHTLVGDGCGAVDPVKGQWFSLRFAERFVPPPHSKSYWPGHRAALDVTTTTTTTKLL